jgi:hypothetical protein
MAAALRLPEINWGWPEIAVILIWKLAPNGFVMLTEDMTSLPFDRVLVEDRQPDKLTLGFVAVRKAKALTRPERGSEKASVSELQGRWMKIGICTLWHFARAHKLGRRDMITLTEQDRQAVPADRQLMASGHAHGVEWRFIRKLEAAKLAAWYRDNEHESAFVTEKTAL